MGNYTETSAVTIVTDLYVNLYFEAGANLTVTLSAGAANQHWLSNTASVGVINITGTSKNSNFITCNYGVFTSQGSSAASKSKLSISNIEISSYGTGFEDVINARYCLLRIDNSSIGNDTTNANGCYIIQSTESFIWIKGSRLNLKTSRNWNGLLTDSPSSIIFETGTTAGGSIISPRIRLHQTSFALNGTYGNFIMTTPSDANNSILFADIYMYHPYSAELVAGTAGAVYNMGSYQDVYYVGGTIVSAGQKPLGATFSWIKQGPTTSGGTIENWQQFKGTAAPY